jgi:hypothetical protein
MSARLTPTTNTSPRREPPRSPAPTSPSNLGTSRGIGALGSQMNNTAITAYNSWYNVMSTEWAWIIYTVILIILLVGGVYVYNMFMYPSNSSTPLKTGSSQVLTPPPISKIDPI